MWIFRGVILVLCADDISRILVLCADDINRIIVDKEEDGLQYKIILLCKNGTYDLKTMTLHTDRYNMCSVISPSPQ